MKRLAVIFTLVFVAGCVDKATQAALDELRNQNRLAVQKAEDAGKLARTVATTRPSTHPIDFANSIIEDIRGPLVRVGFICTLLTFAGIGAIVASKFIELLGGLVKSIAMVATPIFGVTAGGCWLTLWFLPFAFWTILGTLVLAVTVFIIQLAKAHWSIGELLKGTGPLIVLPSTPK